VESGGGGGAAGAAGAAGDGGAGSRKDRPVTLLKNPLHRRKSTAAAEDNVEAEAECCSLVNLGTQVERQRSSVMRFVFHQTDLYLAYKPLVLCDYHVSYLHYRSLELVILGMICCCS
jgi:hypothetical protein